MSDRLLPGRVVAVRVPLLPAGTVARLSGGAARAAWPDGDLDAAVRADAAHLDAGLRALVADPLVRTALGLASPSLDAAVDRWLARPGAAPPRGLLGYVARMAGRPTPFGLFATCAAGTIAGPPAYELAPRSALRARARLDALAADRLVAARAADPAGRDEVTFVPNDTAHVAAGRLRFVERAVDGRAVRYVPVAVEPDDALRLVLDAARDGATLRALAAALTDDDVTAEEAYEYVAELADAQVLVPDVPVVTGSVMAPPVVAALGADPAPDRLRAAVAAVREAVPGTPADRAVHVDATRPATFALGPAVLAAARRAVEVLHPLYRETAADDDLAAFRTAFRARYGDAEVPLLEALDPETGVGFGAPTAVAAAGAPLLAGFHPAPAPEAARWTPVDHHLVDLLSRALRDRATEIELGHADLHPLRNQRPRPLPDVLTLRGTVAAASAADVAAGRFRLVVHGVTGVGGAGIVSRFADLDPELAALVREQAAREEALRPDAVFAEVVHLPEHRAGNAVVRPATRAYEIPLLAASAVPPERRIPPGDLLVSFAGDRVVLRSERLGREVLPRLTAPDDGRASALPAYRFLAAVQHDGTAGLLGWSWGPVDSAPFLPRVVVGPLVLARAQWRLFKPELGALMGARTTAARYDAVQRLRAEWDVPRWATLAFGSYEIPVDLDGVAAAELLARAARRAGQVWLREQLPAPDELCLTGDDGAYAHEFALPLVRAEVEPRPAPVARPRPRAYVPGSEWLGVRLACGPGAADGVLREVVAPLAARAGLWSYERGAGPEPHLLVRLHGDGLALTAAVRDRTGPHVDSGRLADVRLETHRPAGDERLAHADSLAALRVVAAGDDLDARWRAALWGVDRLLADAALDDAGRAEALRRLRDRALAGLGDTGPRAVRWAGRVLRARRDELDGPEPWLRDVLDARSAALVPVLRDAPREAFDALCLAHVNRLLRAAHDVQRLVVVDLLARLDRGRAGRAAATGRQAAGRSSPSCSPGSSG